MKLYLLKLLAALFPLFSSFTLAADESPVTVPWPAGAEGLIDKAIAIKKDAQKRDMTMRTENGEAGIRFAKCMEDLAATLADAKIEPKLLEAEGRDLKAKIALWALDRKHRPDEYARFAERHVNAPEGEEGLERFYGYKPVKTPYPRFLNPHPVSKENAVDAKRWIIEYLYFAPPTGREFVEFPGRNVLGAALRNIRNEKSLVLLKFDLETQIEAFPDALPGTGSGARIGGDAVKVLDFGTTEAFKITASLLRHAGVRRPQKIRPVAKL